MMDLFSDHLSIGTQYIRVFSLPVTARLIEKAILLQCNQRIFAELTPFAGDRCHARS